MKQYILTETRVIKRFSDREDCWNELDNLKLWKPQNTYKWHVEDIEESELMCAMCSGPINIDTDYFDPETGEWVCQKCN